MRSGIVCKFKDVGFGVTFMSITHLSEGELKSEAQLKLYSDA